MIDQELHRMVPHRHLDKLAGYGLRGEILFPVPCIIKAQPAVSGYYRLVLGISGKDYGRRGLGKWIQVEKGERADVSDQEIRSLCETLIAVAGQFLEGINRGVSEELFHEMALLTLGAQLDGSYRVMIGQQAVAAMRYIIENILKDKGITTSAKDNLIQFTNAAGRLVEIQFGSDPDILVTEYTKGQPRYVLAVEVKGGTDPSNIHNRLGEAEKSHLKLVAAGVWRWTVVGVAIDEETARQRSPSTNRFYVMSDLIAETGPEYESFRRDLISVLGLPE